MDGRLVQSKVKKRQKLTDEGELSEISLTQIVSHVDFQVEEKVRAEGEYQRGLQEQKTSILLTEESPDIFQIKLGHLPPGAGARVSCIQPQIIFSVFWKQMRIF